VQPKETRRFFEFNPILGFIQAHSSFEIWVKVNLSKEILQMCYKYINADELEIPFKLVCTDQVLPVEFTIKAKLSNGTINISPSHLDFGRLFKGTGSRLALTFENLSALP